MISTSKAINRDLRDSVRCLLFFPRSIFPLFFFAFIVVGQEILVIVSTKTIPRKMPTVKMTAEASLVFCNVLFLGVPSLHDPIRELARFHRSYSTINGGP